MITDYLKSIKWAPLTNPNIFVNGIRLGNKSTIHTLWFTYENNDWINESISYFIALEGNKDPNKNQRIHFFCKQEGEINREYYLTLDIENIYCIGQFSKWINLP